MYNIKSWRDVKAEREKIKTNQPENPFKQLTQSRLTTFLADKLSSDLEDMRGLKLWLEEYFVMLHPPVLSDRCNGALLSFIVSIIIIITTIIIIIIIFITIIIIITIIIMSPCSATAAMGPFSVSSSSSLSFSSPSSLSLSSSSLSPSLSSSPSLS
jgi:hypothetical protein